MATITFKLETNEANLDVVVLDRISGQPKSVSLTRGSPSEVTVQASPNEGHIGIWVPPRSEPVLDHGFPREGTLYRVHKDHVDEGSAEGAEGKKPQKAE